MATPIPNRSEVLRPMVLPAFCLLISAVLPRSQHRQSATHMRLPAPAPQELQLRMGGHKSMEIPELRFRTTLGLQTVYSMHKSGTPQALNSLPALAPALLNRPQDRQLQAEI
jgi:hypothetical protein